MRKSKQANERKEKTGKVKEIEGREDKRKEKNKI